MSGGAQDPNSGKESARQYPTVIETPFEVILLRVTASRALKGPWGTIFLANMVLLEAQGPALWGPIRSLLCGPSRALPFWWGN